jgi:alcohol dehydrogenase/L-iditol 2-dehydrogenase
VALNAVTLAQVRPGQHCLILGAGSQGLLACLAVRQAGGIAHITDPHSGRLALAKELGASSDDNRHFTAVIETSGAPRAFEHAVERAAPGGRLVLVGQSTTPARIPSFALVQKRLTVRGCLIYDHPGDFARTLAVMAEGRLRPGRTVRARFDVADAAAAFAACAEVAGKTWITFQEQPPAAPV